ncbi:MAG: hypothetical protein RR743_00055 [Oscillospiraceae bacterium]
MSAQNANNKKHVEEQYQYKDWMRLDNAATIYPAISTKRNPSMFRLSMELTETVDPEVLKIALEHTLKRLPGFAQRLRVGLFWHYFEHQDNAPPVLPEVNSPCGYLDGKSNNNFMLRVRYFGKRISTEFFHALSDGMGAMVFFKTLVAEYLILKYNAQIPFDDGLLDCREMPKERETEDSFLKHARPISIGRDEKPAYHMGGTREAPGVLHIITAQIPLNEIHSKAKEYSATINELLVAVLIMSVYNIQQREARASKKIKPIKVNVPINMRKFYSSHTLRNFTSFVNVGIEPLLGKYSLEEIIAVVHHTMALEATEKVLNAKMSTNVTSGRNKAIRITPLFIKNRVMKLIVDRVGSRASSVTLTNIGLFKLPDEMEKYVDKIVCHLGAGVNPVACSCMSYKGVCNFTFTRTVTEPFLEREFIGLLVKMGINVKLESNLK